MTATRERRVILIYWKERALHPFEAFSNLKIFCLSYPRYNYNTINNYLSKKKIAYENDEVRIERLTVTQEAIVSPPVKRKIVAVVNKGYLKEMDEKQRDLDYWLSRPATERLKAVTTIIRQSMKKGQRMDKSIIHKKTLEHDI